MRSLQMLEFQLTPDSISTMYLWLTALLGISFLLTIVFLLKFASPRFVLSPKYDRFSRLLLAVLASLQILAWQLYFYRDSHDTVALWCFAIAMIGGVLVWQFSGKSQSRNSSFIRSLPIAIALVSLVEFAGFAQATMQFSHAAQGIEFTEIDEQFEFAVTQVAKTELCGKTDCGTPIQLFERQMTSDDFQNYIDRSQAAYANLSQIAMLRAKPSIRSNCHGWVFARGEHILRGTDIPIILNENHYTAVSKPTSNDIAVYRSAEGEVLHTGLVRGSLEGATIVESKWGIGALYMHIAEEQPYSQNITYYRTDRPSHDILVSVAAAMVADSNLQARSQVQVNTSHSSQRGLTFW